MGVGNSQCSQVQALRNAVAGELNHGNEIHRVLVKFVVIILTCLDLHQLKLIVKMF
jgi:hypothetical protein